MSAIENELQTRAATARPSRRLAAVGLLAVASLLGVSACDQQDTAEVEDVGELVEASPSPGQAVIVNGEVGELLTEQAMTLTDQETGEEVLVLVRSTATVDGITGTTGGGGQVGTVARTGDVVEVMGTMETFERERLEEETGLILNEELFGSWEGQPVLLVDQLNLATVVQPSPQDGDGDLVTPVPESPAAETPAAS